MRGGSAQRLPQVRQVVCARDCNHLIRMIELVRDSLPRELAEPCHSSLETGSVRALIDGDRTSAIGSERLQL